MLIPPGRAKLRNDDRLTVVTSDVVWRQCSQRDAAQRTFSTRRSIRTQGLITVRQRSVFLSNATVTAAVAQIGSFVSRDFGTGDAPQQGERGREDTQETAIPAAVSR